MAKNTWYTIMNKAGSAEILIYKPIGSSFFQEGIDAEDFIKDFKAIDSNEITIRFNTPGGNVFQGHAIANYISQSGKTITAINDGMCASIGTEIFLAADIRKAAKNSKFIIHNVQSQAAGTARDLRSVADRIDAIENDLIDLYTDKLNYDREKVVELVNAETQFTSQEALANGFIQEEISGLKAVACSYDKDLNFINLIKPNPKNKPNPKGEKKMENILKILGVTTEAEAEAKIEQMTAQIADFQASTDAMSKVQNEQTIDLAIAQGKLLPAKKDLALKMLNSDENLYTDFIKSEVVIVPTGEILTPENKLDVSKLTSFKQVLADPTLDAKLLAENPSLYNELYDKFTLTGE